MHYRTAGKISNGLYLGGVALLLIGVMLRSASAILWYILLGICILAMVAAMVITLKYYVCPHCGHVITARGEDLGDCPVCGEHIE